MVWLDCNGLQMNLSVATILNHRALFGHRDSTYAMLLQLVAADRLPECLTALQQMVTIPRLGCWRDVRGFIQHFETHGRNVFAAAAVPLIAGCVHITNEQIRRDCFCSAWSWAAKWVPREPKCRKSPMLQWYYDALAADMFPGAPDAKRRYRKLVAAMTPPQTKPQGLTQLVKRALTEPDENASAINAAFMQHKRENQNAAGNASLVPALSLAHSMGPGHNNCLHTGIGVALLFLSSNSTNTNKNNNRMITFSSHAQWHQMDDPDDFVSNVRYLAEVARAPTNGLNANLDAVYKLVAEHKLAAEHKRDSLLVISDLEHDNDCDSGSNDNETLFWDASSSADYYKFHWWQRMTMPASSANTATSGSLL